MEILLDILSKRNLSLEEVEMIERTFTLLLLLPVVTTITGIARYIVGLTSLNVYAPIVLTFAFYELGYIESEGSSDILRGLKFGIFLYIIVFLSSLFIYKLLKGLRMHFIPKASIVLTGVSVSIILAIFLGTLVFERKGLIYLDVFSIIMIATISHIFISILARKTVKYTAVAGIHTLITSTISYSIISLKGTHNITINYSILLVTGLILVNIYVGQFLGLRLNEYWRFRDLLFKDQVIYGKAKSKKTKKK